VLYHSRHRENKLCNIKQNDPARRTTADIKANTQWLSAGSQAQKTTDSFCIASKYLENLLY
jgi:hypothetical protein